MNILLAVSGSVAAYKALDLTRNLVKRGHSVRVLLTSGAMEFVLPQTFSYLGAQAVYHGRVDFCSEQGRILHIELGRWADQMVVAPLSANSLANLACGKACDLLTSVFLAWDQNKPVILFPAMNSRMLEHPFVVQNLAKVESLDFCFGHPSDSGRLACGDYGLGKFPSVDLIQNFVESFSLKSRPEKILITTGATLAPLDSVRYLTNASSGRTGWELAKQALKRGYQVVVVAGFRALSELDYLAAHPRYRLKRVVSTDDLGKAVAGEWGSSLAYISSAAVGDLEFEKREGKIRKDSFSDGLSVKKSFDVLSWVLKNRNGNQKVVGFAAEASLDREGLEEKWNKKKVDLLVGTKVDHGLNGGSSCGFESERADYLIKEGGEFKEKNLSKADLANRIMDWVDSCW